MRNGNKYFPQSIPHPGLTLQEKLEELNMGPKEFAIRTGKPEKTIIAVLKGESAITPDMAIQFEKVTNIPAHFWLNHQLGYDEFVAREKSKQVIEDALAWAHQFPIAEMIKKEWLPKFPTKQEQAVALLSFFSFATHYAWEDYYFNQLLKVRFRISLAHVHEPYAISAWLRKGELQADKLPIKEYSEKSFKEVLPEIKLLMANHPDGFFNQLQHLCLSAGVKVVYTPCLNKAPINGSTRWINDSPLIQLTGRYKRNDIFWFTFFHEAGHILLHGKKDIFLENIEYNDKDDRKESEADQFAVKCTLNEQEEWEILQHPLTVENILHYAERYRTHPAIIVGRLQHNKHLPFSLGRQFFQPVELI
jgi:HTH-type transcriptional regulator/antitoxin HigA